MRTYLHDFLCLAYLLIKSFPWKKVAKMSSSWTIGALLCFSKYLGKSFVDNVALLYSPHNAKLIYIIVFYMSLCIPMVYTMLYTQIQMDEEYLYSRIRGRYTIIFARILVHLVANIFSIFIELVIVALFHLLRFESFSLDDSINSIICLGMWKFLQKTTLTLMLLLHELRKKNVFSLFTILTGIILIVAIGLLGESGFWIYSSPSAWDIIVQYLIGVILLLSAIVYTEHIRDISF